MTDDNSKEAEVASQASTFQDDDDDSFSAGSDFADTEPIKGWRADNKGKKKERGYKSFEECEETTPDGASEKGKINKRPSFFKIGFQKPKVKEKEKEKQKEKEKEKQKEKQKAKDKNKEKERSMKEQEKQNKVTAKSKEKEKGRSRSKSKENKEREKPKKHSSSSVLESTEPAELRPVFGVPLSLAVERSNPHDGIQLPLIVRDCIDYIEANGMFVEGIYRLSGVKSRIDALRTAYDTAGEEVDLTDQDPHIVAGLLKLFLRELPEPVLTQRVMVALEESSKTQDNKLKVQMFRGAINELPTCNKTLLSWVIVHMAHVIGNEIETKMNLQNISIVLCPTLHISHRVLNVFFSFWRDIFGDVVLKKVKRRLRWRASRTSLELPDSSLILEEELRKQEAILNEMHERLNKGTADKNTEEQLWEVQRIVTQLKRKIRVCRKTSETAIAPTYHEEEKEVIEEKSEDDKADDSVFMETVPEVAEMVEEKTPEKNEVKTNVEEPMKEDVAEKPVLTENNQDVVEEESDKNDEPIEDTVEDNVAVEKVVVEEEINIQKEEEEEIIVGTERLQETEKEEIVIKDVENKLTDVQSDEPVKETEDQIEEKEFKQEFKNENVEVKENNEVRSKEEEEMIELLLITHAEAMARQQELKKIQSDLQERIQAERNDVERLRQKLAEEERNESLYVRSSSFESSNSSNSSNSSSESDDEDELMEILTKLRKENEQLNAENNQLVLDIHSERERCVDIRVEMSTLTLKQDLAKKRLSSAPAPLETDL